MNANAKVHFVYVYIDPRNFRWVYVGEGKGSRHLSHLHRTDDSETARKLAEIRADGLEPLVRVIARNLTKAEARLVEKTLLWSIGHSLTNIATGHFSATFRKPNSMHIELPGFDFANQIYYFNVAEGKGETRVWVIAVNSDFSRPGRIMRSGVKCLSLFALVILSPLTSQSAVTSASE